MAPSLGFVSCPFVFFVDLPVSAPSRSVLEAGSLRPRLREGLRCSVQGEGGARACVLEDPHTSRFHRVGLHEYRFVAELDGTRTVASILAQLARHGGGESFTEAEALQILRWLAGNHLLEIESGRPESERGEGERSIFAAITWLNPLILKIPLARPDRLFAAVAPKHAAFFTSLPRPHRPNHRVSA